MYCLFYGPSSACNRADRQDISRHPPTLAAVQRKPTMQALMDSMLLSVWDHDWTLKGGRVYQWVYTAR